jgi:hypothetical protein
MLRIPRHLCWALLPLLLSGCSTSGLEWSVTRFHELSAIKGKTFIIVPMQPELAGSLEFKSYAQAAAKRLTEVGMTELPDSKFGSSDYLVGLDYGLGPPVVVKASQEIYGVVTPRTTTLATAVNPITGGPVTVLQQPSYGTVGFDTVSTVNYHRYVQLFIQEGRPGADGKFRRKYEGIAESDGTSRDLAWLVPEGITALLTEFPGTSGKSVTVHGSK